MRNTKLEELIRSLSLNEKNSFERYLSSPYLNTNERVVRLFALLKVTSKDFPSKAQLFKKLFPDKKYNDKKIRYLFSYLSSHLENFFALRELESDEQQYRLLLLKSLSRREGQKSYSFIRIRQDKNKKFEQASNYLNQFLAAELHYSYSAKRFSRINQLNYSQVVDNLDRFYFLRKLQLYCESLNLKNVLRADQHHFLINEICDLITRHHYFGSKSIEIYYHILLTLQHPENENHFEKLVMTLKQHKSSFSAEDLNDMYVYVKNYCIKMINTGKDAFRSVLFGIYKDILSDERLLNRESFSQWEFKNIVTLGLRLKQNKWVHNFIHHYIRFLTQAERDNALRYNSAMLAFAEKDFRQSIKLLREVEFTDLYYALDSRSLLMKVYFETDDSETLLYHISAFKVYLRRNKLVSRYQREIYSKFIRYTLKLFRAGISRSKLTDFTKELNQIKNISDRSWLLEKANELIA